MTDALLLVSDLWKSHLKPGLPFWKRKQAQEERLFHAVRSVELQLARGECLGIVGESGSGKTTLLRMLAGLVTPSRGRILVSGRPFEPKEDLETRARVQMVFQDPTESLNPSFTVRRIIAEPLLRLGSLPDPARLPIRVEELCDIVHLPRELIDRYPHQLSGGQKARVGIARAIAPNPELLLLDEPTTALDVSVQARILLLLHDLRERLRMSFVFVSHDLGVIRLLCDRVVVMKEGAIVERGNVKQVMASPEHPYTKSLIAALPRLDRRSNDVSGLAEDPCGFEPVS